MAILKILLALILLTVGANLINQPDDLMVASGCFLVGVSFWLIYTLIKPLTHVLSRPTKTRKKNATNRN